MKDCVQGSLEWVLHHAVQEITAQFGGLQLIECNGALSNDVCTILTTFFGDQAFSLAMYVDRPLLERLTRFVLGQVDITDGDMEDVMMEYFNILCGRIVAGLFRMRHISSRFQIPSFVVGRAPIKGDTAYQCVLNYTDGNDECLRLVYIAPDDFQQN